jgi:hypothetical protein
MVGAGLSAAIGVTLPPADASAGVDQWTELTLPPGAFAMAIAADPVTADTVYVAASGGLLHRTTDGGGTWTTIDLDALRPDENAPVLSAVAVDPTNAENVIVGGNHGRIYWSDNGGGTWTDDRVEQGGGSEQTINAVELGVDLGFSFEEGDPSALAGTSNGVWYAVDFKSGHWDVDSSWTVGGSVPEKCREVHAIAVHPHNHAVQYAGTDCGLYKTTTPNDREDANAWQRVATVPETAQVRAIVIDPQQPDTLYIATDTGIRRLTGGGATATLISTNNLPEQAAWALAIDPINTSLLYAGLATQGVFKGNPAGSGRWIAFNPGLGARGIRALAQSGADPRRLYAMTAAGDVYGIAQTYVPTAPMDLAVSYATLPPGSVALNGSSGRFTAVATVRNSGPASATGIKFALSFEKVGALGRPVSAWADVSVASLRAGSATCTIASTKAFCELGTLAPGTSRQVTFEVLLRASLSKNRLTTIAAVSGAAAGDLWSTAEVSSGNNQSKTYTNVK